MISRRSKRKLREIVRRWLTGQIRSWRLLAAGVLIVLSTLATPAPNSSGASAARDSSQVVLTGAEADRLLWGLGRVYLIIKILNSAPLVHVH